MKLSEKIQEALREQQEINLSDPAVQKRLAAQWGYVPAEAQPAPSVPAGWKLVPIEPTVKIRKAMHYAYWQKQSPQMPYHDGSTELWNAAYAAMLAAAPEAKP